MKTGKILWLAALVVVCLLGIIYEQAAARNEQQGTGEPLDTWVVRNPFTPESDRDLNGVGYGNNTFVAVGQGLILTSFDWITWHRKTFSMADNLRKVAYGNSTFVVVGNHGDYGLGVIFRSPDGMRWTRQSFDAALTGVAHGNGTFVAVGDNGIFTSPDGIYWTLRREGEVRGVAFGNNMFVAVGSGILTSPDGISWTPRDGTNRYLFSAAYGNNTFVVTGSGAFGTSSDGVTWIQKYTPGSWTGITFGNNTFVAVDFTCDLGGIFTSLDGITWTMKYSAGCIQLSEVVYGAGSFVAVGRGEAILQSVDETGTFPLRVSKTGTGEGTVISDPTGVECGDMCLFSFSESTMVTLTATPALGSTLESWSGCTSSSDTICVVTLDRAKFVTAVFSLVNPRRLTVSKIKRSRGDGTVISNPSGIECGKNCSALFYSGAPVALTASADPASDSVFTGWSASSCPGTDPCMVTIDKTTTVKATFVGPQPLTVIHSSIKKGGGSVSSSPSGIDCTTTCKHAFTYNSQVTLTAVPNAGSSFGGWKPGSLNCSGTSCTITMDKARAVTAVFVK